MAKKPKKNHLAGEKSPYLQQHVYNPVDWYPWGDKAIALAERTDKPIFLSIGYATCHWCHVMERESFESEEIAEQLNSAFVCIKVDREERPDVDALYMECANHLLVGEVGWPLNLFLTPSLQPFYAFTYLPPHSRMGALGLSELIEKIQKSWHSSERLELVEQGKRMEDILQQTSVGRGLQLPHYEEINFAIEDFFRLADADNGGLLGAPKFPMSYQIQLFLRFSVLHGDERGAWLAEKTLESMAKGGIYDHIGGGFCRYSVDNRWHVPHFEKMLYDQALIADAYLEGWLITEKEPFRVTCMEILDYLLRDLRAPEGAFYSAEDAETEEGEGAYYLWTPEEIEEVLGDEDAQLFTTVYDVVLGGNFKGKTVLNRVIDLKEFAALIQIPLLSLEDKLFEARQKLFERRDERIRPEIDDKILTGWNALAAHTLARAGIAFSEQEYLDAAEEVLLFLKKEMWTPKGLKRRWKEGEARFNGTLDDYVALARAALTLSSVGGAEEWLAWAIELTDQIEEKFKIPRGAYYQTEKEASNLLSRRCQLADTSEPSGNALHCENLLRLHQLTGEGRYLEGAKEILMAVQPPFLRYPPGFGYHLLNFQRYYDSKRDSVVLALPKGKGEELLEMLWCDARLHREWLVRTPKDKNLKEIFPFQKPIKGMPTAYRCTTGFCQLPIVGEDAIMEELD